MTPEEQTLFGIDKLNVVRFDIPAVTHVDYSARIQTVHANTNPLFHRLLKRFKALTGCAVLVNHQLQCPWWTDRLHAAGRIPLLYGQ
jgi:carbamoyltransferase